MEGFIYRQCVLINSIENLKLLNKINKKIDSDCWGLYQILTRFHFDEKYI